MAPWRRGGAPVLVAIDSRGEHVAELTVPRGADTDDATACLWTLLDSHEALLEAQ